VSPDDLVYMNAGMRVYPGTPLYRIAVSEGLVKDGDPLLDPPVYYYSASLGKSKLDSMIREAARTRPNCIPALETAPPPAMIREAMELKRSEKLEEPMFRTLLRVRKQWMAEGKL
jgi:hypothetical protein